VSQQINLLPAALRTDRASFTSATAMAYAIGGAVVLAVLYGLYEEYRLRGIEAEARAVALELKEATAARPAPAGARNPAKPSAELEARITELSAQLSARQEIVDAVKNGSVGSTNGISEYMRVFSRQSLEGLWLTGFDIAAGGGELGLSGRAIAADLVPVYLQRLNREPSMQGRQFASVVINQGGAQERALPRGAARAALPPYVEFQISSSDATDAKGRPQTSAAAPRGAVPIPAPATSPRPLPEGSK
jgi:hypothetical protein